MGNVLEAVLEALEKQDPIEPIEKKSRLFTCLTCARCGYFFPTGTKPKYCQECGQKVNWEETNYGNS